MAHVYRITQDKRYLDAALKTWMMGEVSVGLSLARDSQLQQSNTPYFEAWSINPLMHLFEALLALYDVTQSPSVWQDIEFIAQFVEDDLLQPQGYIAEYYEQVNQPLAVTADFTYFVSNSYIQTMPVIPLVRDSFFVYVLFRWGCVRGKYCSDKQSVVDLVYVFYSYFLVSD